MTITDRLNEIQTRADAVKECRSGGCAGCLSEAADDIPALLAALRVAVEGLQSAFDGPNVDEVMGRIESALKGDGK